MPAYLAEPPQRLARRLPASPSISSWAISAWAQPLCPSVAKPSRSGRAASAVYGTVAQGDFATMLAVEHDGRPALPTALLSLCHLTGVAFAAVCAHPDIEKGVHQALNTIFDKDYGLENLAITRKVALNEGALAGSTRSLVPSLIKCNSPAHRPRIA